MAEIEWLMPEENLSNFSIAKLASELTQKLQGRVQMAFLFGSAAKGTATPSSDIDLILVTETKEEFSKRALMFQDLKEVFPRMDLFVYTPKEFEAGLMEPSFIQDQSDHWIQLR